uniref:Uncharacterized protein n=1 Tax=Arundo donax TaxID=35708 RepID=A0A0A8YKX5_ARUDO
MSKSLFVLFRIAHPLVGSIKLFLG